MGLIDTATTASQIRLRPQEHQGTCRFSSRLVATAAAHEKFGPETVVQALALVKAKAQERDGLDYLQVLEVDGQALWLIDDGTVVTALLPEDY